MKPQMSTNTRFDGAVLSDASEPGSIQRSNPSLRSSSVAGTSW